MEDYRGFVSPLYSLHQSIGRESMVERMHRLLEKFSFGCMDEVVAPGANPEARLPHHRRSHYLPSFFDRVLAAERGEPGRLRRPAALSPPMSGWRRSVTRGPSDSEPPPSCPAADRREGEPPLDRRLLRAARRALREIADVNAPEFLARLQAEGPPDVLVS